VQDISGGASIFSISATDSDSGVNGVVQYLLFGVGSNFFSINQTTGEVLVAESGVDFEVVNVIGNPLILTIIVQDSGKPLFKFDGRCCPSPLTVVLGTK
jgi:hypothetical protein